MVTDAGTFRTKDSNRKPNKINKNGRSAKYIHASKSLGKMSRQTNPPIPVPLLRIQMSNINKCIPVHYRIRIHKPMHCNLSIPLSARIYHNNLLWFKSNTLLPSTFPQHLVGSLPHLGWDSALKELLNGLWHSSINTWAPVSPLDDRLP